MGRHSQAPALEPAGAHPHPHPHAHPHRHVEDYAARKHPEFVVLDIGEDRGALILHTDPGMHGVEVEISPAGADEQRSHKQILERSAGGASEFTAVFDGLSTGAYTLWVDDEAWARAVAVEGGRVAELDWRGRS